MNQDRNKLSRKLLDEAKSLHQQKQLESAISRYRDALAIDPQQPETHYLLGNAFLESGQLTAAVDAYKGLLSVQPNHLEGLNNLGALLRHMGDPEAAVDFLLRALQKNKNSAETRVNLADTYRTLGYTRPAIEQARAALELRPDFFDAHKSLAASLQEAGRMEEALDCYNNAQALRPQAQIILLERIHLLEMVGKHQEAWSLLEPLIDSGIAGALMAFFDLSAHIDRRDEAVSKLQALLKNGDIPATTQSPVHFRLGKHYEKTGQFDLAFSHFHSANQLAGKDYDMNKVISQVEAIISTYNCEFTRTMPRAENDSRYPVFILGMPRSGTSLVEQILASHPDVFGGGELLYIDEAAGKMATRSGKNRAYPACVKETGQKFLGHLADQHLQHLMELSGNMPHVTDKMPHNFLYIGLIAQFFPKASIIHCQRNPRDTCLSCYFSDFGGNSHDYAYDLSTLGAYYGQYQKLMNHWQEVLGNRILTINYEELVTHQEQVTRSLLNFCDLDWNEQCLDFHQSGRTVYTLSHAQIRKPLYSTSLGRWRNYEHHLAPLFNALDMGNETGNT